MHYDNEFYFGLFANQSNHEGIRNINTSDIYIENGYKIEAFAQDLDSPISMVFSDEGELIVAASGLTSGNPQILKLVNNEFVTIANNFNLPITGVNYLNGIIYVSHKGSISRIDQKGMKQTIIAGLPSNGDHFNSKVVFGPDNKLYFGQGTVTNSGVVGLDNKWINHHPLLFDYPGDYIMLNGQNYTSNNISNEFNPDEEVLTGAFSPFATPNLPYELRKRYLKASGSILRSNMDGTKLELYAWGFRNPAYLKFDIENKLYVANQGYDLRGSRPIANAPDEFYEVDKGLWYGWPDYSGGEPVTLPRFRSIEGGEPEFLIKNHPNSPPLPIANFPMNSNIMGFDFNYNKNFGPYGDAYIAEYGSTELDGEKFNTTYAGVGHRISRIDIHTGVISTFAINKSGFPSSITREGGLERPTELVFGPDGSMYILDIGLDNRNKPGDILPNTGVIWRISRVR